MLANLNLFPLVRRALQQLVINKYMIILSNNEIILKTWKHTVIGRREVLIGCFSNLVLPRYCPIVHRTHSDTVITDGSEPAAINYINVIRQNKLVEQMRQLFEKRYSWQLNLLLEKSLPFTACESRGEQTADGPRKTWFTTYCCLLLYYKQFKLALCGIRIAYLSTCLQSTVSII